MMLIGVEAVCPVPVRSQEVLFSELHAALLQYATVWMTQRCAMYVQVSLGRYLRQRVSSRAHELLAL